MDFDSSGTDSFEKSVPFSISLIEEQKFLIIPLLIFSFFEFFQLSVRYNHKKLEKMAVFFNASNFIH